MVLYNVHTAYYIARRKIRIIIDKTLLLIPLWHDKLIKQKRKRVSLNLHLFSPQSFLVCLFLIFIHNDLQKKK